MNKCEKCGAPIGGFWSHLAKLWGVKKSTTHPKMCNKCAPGGDMPAETTKPASDVPAPEPMVESTPAATAKPDGDTPSVTHTCSGPSCTHPSHKKEM